MRKLSLDSSFVIDYLKDRNHATNFYDDLDSPRLLISSLVKLEVKTGDRNIGRFDDLDSISFNDQHMREALEMISFLEENGDMINKLDIMIAAQSAVKKTELIATDSDFQSLDDYEGFDYEVIQSE